MKKLLLIVVVLLMAAPFAQGEIAFTFTNNGNGSCTITYDVNDVYDGQRPVAMGLLVEVTSGTPITEADISDPGGFFEIFMDAAYSIESDPCDPCGYQYGDGTPIADPCGPGEVSLPRMRFSISMGGLGGENDPDQKSPPTSGTITLWSEPQDPCQGGSEGGETEFTVGLDNLRGGIIGDDGEPMVVLGLHDGPAKQGGPPDKISECVKWGAPFYNIWSGKGNPGAPSPPPGSAYWQKPQCFCYKRHCRGDSTGDRDGPYNTGISDLLIFLAGDGKLKPNHTDETICGDTTHSKDGPYFVGISDLLVFLEYDGDYHWDVTDCPPDWDGDLDVDFNFWIVTDKDGNITGFEDPPLGPPYPG